VFTCSVTSLLFGERSSVVVDPTEERLRSEFDGVECTHIPLHVIVRIDQVARPGHCEDHRATRGSREGAAPAGARAAQAGALTPALPAVLALLP
jgi:hypothetical protein